MGVPVGHRSTGLILTLADREVWHELNSGMDVPLYALLNQLATILPGVEADTCATWRSFTFSGMSRQAGGWKDYCLHPERRTQISDDRGLNSQMLAHERCKLHTFIRDADRKRPQLRR